MMELTELKPAPYNPRTIDDKALAGLAKSIGEFGDVSGICWNRRTGHLVTGHQRLAALRGEHGDGLNVQGSDEDGWALVAPGCEAIPIRIVDWDDNRERAANVVANNEHICGTWDYPSLERLLTELKSTEFGELFSILRLDEFLDEQVGDGLTDPDAIPEPPDEAITQPGDLIILGNHRLLCGDSANASDVDRLLDGQPIHLCNTDPPYNVRVEPRSNNAIAAGLSSFGEHGLMHHQSFDVHRAEKKRSARRRDATGGNEATESAKRTASKYHGFDVATGGQSGRATHKKLRPKDRPLVNDFVSDEAFDAMLHAWFGNIARVLLPGRTAYIWGGYANIANYPPVLKACGLYFSQTIIWHKQWPVLTRKDFMGDHEWCFYTWREGAAHVFLGPNNVPDVWSVRKITPNAMTHLTEKPVELAVRAIQYSSRTGENVLDLFGGSGSTLIAAEQTGRRAFLMELDPLYCDVIVQRWEKFTGRKAARISARSNAPVVAEALVERK
jgi:DNA modification methylase